jgi:pyroglutamyl-peptidase
MTGAPVRILLTGFLPFARRSTNPSATAVRQFSGARLHPRTDVPVELVKRILKVDRNVQRNLRRTADPGSFDIILHLGVGRQVPAVVLERVAYNKVNADLRDTRGRRGLHRPVIEHGPWTLKSTLPFRKIQRRFLDEKIPCGISHYAGNHICNYLLYGSLFAMRRGGRGKLVGFMHLPDFSVLPCREVHRALESLLDVCIQDVIRRRRRTERRRRLLCFFGIPVAERRFQEA